MTSLTLPDYTIEIALTDQIQVDTLNALAGHNYSIRLQRQHNKRPLGGMISIPNGNAPFKLNTTVSNTTVSCWLWTDSRRALIPTAESFNITLLDECDPMFLGAEEKAQVEAMLPQTFTARLGKTKDASDCEVMSEEEIKAFLRREAN